ncbi:hypothetical protein [Williamsoniiplasma luminosum]|uniref:hypothetical protein n=1 Tax=Williamsoniiplasma luminosum TaxID=214888 RepID=UPI00047241DB|nr:hypothetical protein [Williamsoniiplasma luminosum]
MKTQIPRKLKTWLKDLSQDIFLLKKDKKPIIKMYTEHFEKNLAEGKTYIEILNDLEPINVIAEKIYKKHNIIYTETVSKNAKIIGWTGLVFQPLIILTTIALFLTAALLPAITIWQSVVLYQSYDFWEATSIACLIIGATPFLMVLLFLMTEILFNFSNQLFININWMQTRKAIKAMSWKLWLGLFLIASLLLASIAGLGTIFSGNASLIYYATNPTLKNEQIITKNLKGDAVDAIDISKVTIDDMIQRALIFGQEQAQAEAEKMREQTDGILRNGQEQIVRQFLPTDTPAMNGEQILQKNRATLEARIIIEDYKVENALDGMLYQTQFKQIPAIDRSKAGTLIRQHNFKWDLQNQYKFALKEQENGKYTLIIKVTPNNWTQKTVAFGGELFILYI